MVGLSSPDVYDLAVFGTTAALLFVGYVLTSSHLIRVSVWLTIFTIYVCYMGFLAYRWTFDEWE
jgi:hypothetical protein